MKTLIDTDALCEAQKPEGHQGVRRTLAAANPVDLFISVITIGEIAHGIARLPAGSRRNSLETWLGATERHFADRILPIDRDIAQRWGELTARAARSGHTLHAADGLIAATAMHHGMRIMTRNIKHFERCGVPLLNPWET